MKRAKSTFLVYIVLIAILFITGCGQSQNSEMLDLSNPSKLMRSSRQKRDSNAGGNVISTNGSEYTVVFPHKVKRRNAFVSNTQSLIVETANMETLPRLRAEFMTNIDRKTFINNFKNILQNFAYIAGMKNPEITIGNSKLGKEGTYSAIKMVGEYPVRVYGKVFVGEHSVINLMIVEPLQNSLSLEAARFLDSVRRK